jgi:hypothetical protein
VDDERAENARRKTALCERAEALVESTEWDATAEALKQLQAEWKQTGSPPQAEAEALWRRFRTACDRFFDRRNRRHEIERDAVRQQGVTVCEALEALVATIEGGEAPGADEVGQQVDAAWAQWVHLALPTRETQELRERIFAACVRIATGVPDCLRGTRLDPAVTRKRREKLVARLEGLVEPRRAAPAADSLQAMALALRDRLATNTIAGGAAAARPRDVAEEVARIAAGWANTGPVVDDESHELAERYERALALLGSRP